MTGSQIRVEASGPVRTVVIDRPAKRNAMTLRMQQELEARLAECDRDPGCRSVVLTGAGECFSAGSDLDVLTAGRGALEEAVRDGGDRPLRSVRIRKPVVAAVDGVAVGIGLVYALAADIRLATPRAQFIAPFAQLGLVAEYGAAWLLGRMIGLSRASEMLLTGRAIDGAEAAAIGLVHRVVEPEQLRDAAQALAADVAERGSPSAMAVIKRQLWDAAAQPADAAAQDAINSALASFARPDLWEALAARDARRRPGFPALESTDPP